MTNPVTVYFDGACPLCRREIAWYQKQRGADAVSWVDVSAGDDETIENDLSRTQAMARFHVRLPDGQLVDGPKAFAELWVVLPRFSVLGKLVRQPWIIVLANPLYRIFLKLRPLIQKVFFRKPTFCS
ncbi:MAG: DUF393 domain-containing protein [Pseudomonadota bacterium]